mmetsp:Transcript_4100/g.10114  ORF Transcript_4100/g.10114 Transcript_4100/m.10114 type:complete len:199 (-) Transcript_4100:984-1580(-)
MSAPTCRYCESTDDGVRESLELELVQYMDAQFVHWTRLQRVATNRACAFVPPNSAPRVAVETVTDRSSSPSVRSPAVAVLSSSSSSSSADSPRSIAEPRWRHRSCLPHILAALYWMLESEGVPGPLASLSTSPHQHRKRKRLVSSHEHKTRWWNRARQFDDYTSLLPDTLLLPRGLVCFCVCALYRDALYACVCVPRA